MPSGSVADILCVFVCVCVCVCVFVCVFLPALTQAVGYGMDSCQSESNLHSVRMANIDVSYGHDYQNLQLQMLRWFSTLKPQLIICTPMVWAFGCGWSIFSHKKGLQHFKRISRKQGEHRKHLMINSGRIWITKPITAKHCIYNRAQSIIHNNIDIIPYSSRKNQLDISWIVEDKPFLLWALA